MRKHIKKIIFSTLFIAIAIVTIIIPQQINTKTYATSTVEKVEAEQAAIQEELAELEEELEVLKEDAEQAEAYQELLESKIILYQSNIDTSYEHVEELNESILELTANIEASALEYAETIELLKERIAAIYTAGTTSTL